ncbi:MAG: diaminopimelate epimerase [Puniceicoccales bacterium]|jgi:diaminopimelate epimerase|nr:diaminopimelate epimerase [Puniceicoccales bacterium]
MFEKYQALGNAYLIFRDEDGRGLDAPTIRTVCDSHYGIGSDGVLIGNRLGDNRFKLEIFNPDASVAEKSGNGLRIFAKFVWDEGITSADELVITTPSGESRCSKFGDEICVNMGRPRFSDTNIPAPADFLQHIDGQVVELHALSFGNPHCVIYVDDLDVDNTKRIGPLVERLPLFPRRTNVQFLKVISNSLIQIQIWERGVGYTLASGSGACAAFAVSKKLNICGNDVIVEMPGGKLFMKENARGEVLQYGSALKIASCIVKNYGPTTSDDPRNKTKL